MKPETRFLPAAELRVENDPGKRPKIRGYAAVFDSLSVDLGGFREVIRPGAFRRGLPGADVRALINHDPSQIIGRNKAGTLRMEEDERGLRVEIDPPDTQIARDLLENMRLGNIDGMSFRFYIAEGGDVFSRGPDGTLRTLTDIEIDDVSIVTYPAYQATSVSARSIERAEAFCRSQSRRTARRDRAERLLRLTEASL